MTRPSRTTCGACGVTGHTVGRCKDVAAIDYWRAVAQRHRAKADEHQRLAAKYDERSDDRAHHSRLERLELENAGRADRKRAKVEAGQ